MWRKQVRLDLTMFWNHIENRKPTKPTFNNNNKTSSY